MDEIYVIEERPKLVVGMRRKGHYREIAEMLPQLYKYAVSKGAIVSEHPMFIWHETSKADAQEADKSGNADIEVCIPIAERIPETKTFKCYELSGGKMAKMLHKGPYETCESTYDKLFAWIEKNRKMITGPIREAYLNDPKQVGINETLTEIYAPIN
ncbi:MAG: GyrI-like domain-containing protein [Methanotrichaceae archaeon]|nr:GyrI-like domain-containing protein [Methanotrichaceae archaeon]